MIEYACQAQRILQRTQQHRRELEKNTISDERKIGASSAEGGVNNGERIASNLSISTYDGGTTSQTRIEGA